MLCAAVGLFILLVPLRKNWSGKRELWVVESQKCLLESQEFQRTLSGVVISPGNVIFEFKCFCVTVCDAY